MQAEIAGVGSVKEEDCEAELADDTPGTPELYDGANCGGEPVKEEEMSEGATGYIIITQLSILYFVSGSVLCLQYSAILSSSEKIFVQICTGKQI